MGDSPPKYGFLPSVYSSDPDKYSGFALSYGMPIPYQEPLQSPTPESLPTTPYPLVNPFQNLTTETESNEPLDIGAPRTFTGGYSWQIIGPESSFPYTSAVRAGRDADGSPIFVGRAFHEGDMVPAKVHPDKRIAYISYQGEEIAKDEYEVLRSGEFVWEFACNGEIPIGAIVIGKTADGEDLYSARCLYRGTQTPGKLHPSHGCLYIPFGGEEVAIQEYEVLVLK
ncbi:uncharacterized protein LOC119071207 [Bradysia coprophila]|uniref:uncharacterized protein LOC119071207 n=1 Tax=Bradysia coprophila TaxID=38358 RepID=UPI00187D81E9|nr:uncharacterized protein LOC119071207 [Bradysia coprophila]